ncbi:MAG: helix-turn-helix domain-containing protein [Candidatus Neomarinimicrobiota bacterium]
MDQAETFYHELKQLRIAQGISLEDISVKTRINIRFLEALEQGQFDVLPKTYVRLFLRSYCQGIGVNEEEALKQLEDYLGEQDERYSTALEDLSAATTSSPRPESTLDVEVRGPARLRRDLIAGTAIFLFLILITFFARRIYQGQTPAEIPSTSTTAKDLTDQPIQTTEPPQPSAPLLNATKSTPTAETPHPATTPPPPRRSTPVVPEESAVELPDDLFAEDRIVAHHMQRIRLTPPVRLTLRARDNVVIQPMIKGQREPTLNLTVADARMWTVQEDLILRTNAIENLRGDLNGIPIELGQASGIGILRVTPTGEYEVYAYADTTR